MNLRRVAARFVVAMEHAVRRSLDLPRHSNEAEFLIMGASDLEGRTMGKPVDRNKTASEVLDVPISDENADWLQRGRATKKKAAAIRVLVRYLDAMASK